MHVSIIIPVYEITAFLEEAVQSAASGDYADKEVLVVDDGSSPENAAVIASICQRYPLVKLLQQPHGGAAAARNFGVANASGELVFFLDADDVLQPGALGFLVGALREHPDAIASYGRVQMMDAGGRLTGGIMPADARIVSGARVLEFLLERKLPFCNGSIIIRKAALEKLDVENTHLTVGEDWVLWCHLALVGTIIPAGNRVVLHRRKHGKNVSAQGIENPELILAAYESIHAHPVFSQALGEEKCRELKEKCLCRIHTYLASAYAANGEAEKAAHHFRQVTLPLSAFDDSGEVA
ncbi:MAG: glycosyltransferase [Alphaproteobacteria bacterium]|nr:glycosyltransferase [Alphaproteobacteria bacterium]